MSEGKTKVIFVQLGSPKSPKVSHVREFLREFLKDPRVVDINPMVWAIILNLFVLPFRPKKSAALYRRIWDGKAFPLITITKNFSDKVRGFIGGENIEVNHAFLLSEPRVSSIVTDWENDPTPATKVKVIPMFPQYSESTIASGIDGLFHDFSKRVNIPDFSVMTNFHTTHAFIENSARIIDDYILKLRASGIEPDKVLFSFHGIQKRRVVYKKDIYYKHCYESFYLIRRLLKTINPDLVMMTFQSRFGSEEWLTPYTEDTVERLCFEGHKNLVVYSPSFVVDCLETIDELGVELKETAHEFGGDVHVVPCLNDDEKWCKDFSKFVENQCLADYETRKSDFFILEESDYKEFNDMSEKELKMKQVPLGAETKSSLKIVFLTIFLDLVGFSIIFPLFPTLAKYYLTVDADNIFLKAIFGSIATIANYSAGTGMFSGIVLFGGILGALYSFLQFIAAPIWGNISDRIGRKPVLLISLSGLALSYVLWFFSGSFTVLIISRIIGGIMGGNISTATAVVADVTSKENRSKGMAFVGIAFALGFVIGPALGGILSLIDLTKIYPALEAYGVNPFSVPAAFAFLLSAFNVVWVSRKFKESLPPEKRGEHTTQRSANPLLIFRPLPFKGVNLVNFGNFLFLTAFSGMEFTLTFLAFERLGYSSMDNAYLFIFIGFILAMVQGGYVRRKAHEVGEKKMALRGLVALIPGLILIAVAQTTLMLYFGLFFLALGSAMTIPCLTSLVTLYSPETHQGRSVGIFRSLGALARVFGPIGASIIYYRYGSSAPYYIGAVFLLIPILMIAKLPDVNKEAN